MQYTGIYNLFSRWADDGSLDKAFIEAQSSISTLALTALESHRLSLTQISFQPSLRQACGLPDILRRKD
ncbi:MAG: hypothetical protein ABI977_23255 [Acidobacteriota bacterium]